MIGLAVGAVNCARHSTQELNPSPAITPPIAISRINLIQLLCAKMPLIQLGEGILGSRLAAEKQAYDRSHDRRDHCLLNWQRCSGGLSPPTLAELYFAPHCPS
jgi:hypothetical protein